MKFLVIAGDASAAARARRIDESSEIIMFERKRMFPLRTAAFPII